MSSRIFNFSAGPAVMPLPVLEQAQRELVSLPGVGMSVMEISHRSKTF
jgi:phosphoserine aminotransferase